MGVISYDMVPVAGNGMILRHVALRDCSTNYWVQADVGVAVVALPLIGEMRMSIM